MYVLPLPVLLSQLNLSREQVVGDELVTIPSRLFRFLIQIALLESDFNEDGYLDANPDLRDAVNDGVIGDPRSHYAGTGFFECRSGATPPVDEEWYLKTFPDVAEALQQGLVASATAHFETIGLNELRAPAPEYETIAVEWARVLGRSKPAPADENPAEAESRSAEPDGPPRRSRARRVPQGSAPSTSRPRRPGRRARPEPA